ncbi:hypothetical protein M513_09430 [Trichuris suis]|uniref:Uncharacterized protein n=1 Tax=Trichuris suis TaxID=68888 RepID=A0A085LXN7_9BILA|nr:hypothetical protein M513_09430 [Trichuris suis]
MVYISTWVYVRAEPEGQHREQFSDLTSSGVRLRVNFSDAPIAILSSMSWFYPLTWDVRTSSLIALPLAVIAGGLHNILAYNQFQKLKVSFEAYLLNVSGLSSVLLLVPVLLNRIFCFNCSVSASEELQFELVDCAVFAGAVVTMTGLIYTQYMMMCHCHPVDYLVLRHLKYTLAAAGQQLTQSFIFVNPVNVFSQVISIVMSIWVPSPAVLVFDDGNYQSSSPESFDQVEL